jgi:replicative DNA helicase
VTWPVFSIAVQPEEMATVPNGNNIRQRTTRTPNGALSKSTDAARDATASEALQYRSAPHNFEAEQALLGAILINNDAMERVSDFLDAEHFFDPLHQQIYETAAKLVASGKHATPITLRGFFETAEPIDAGLTVPQYLGRLAANAATIINAREYGHTVYDLATRRYLIVIGEDVVNAAYDSPVDFPASEQIKEAEARLFALAAVSQNERTEVSGHDALSLAIEQADGAHRRGDRLNGLSMGIPALDDKLGGLAPGDLMVLAGRPGMGKTALGLNVASNVADAGVRVYFASLEMSAEQLGTRLLATRLGISADDLRRGIGVGVNMSAMLAEKRRCVQFHLVINQSSALTIAQFAACVRRAHRKAPLGLVVVDYLQLLRGSVYRGSNRTQEVAEISAGLKAIAKDLNVSVIALSQLSRATETAKTSGPNFPTFATAARLNRTRILSRSFTVRRITLNANSPTPQTFPPRSNGSATWTRHGAEQKSSLVSIGTVRRASLR